jgi:hypothetical protein
MFLFVHTLYFKSKLTFFGENVYKITTLVPKGKTQEATDNGDEESKMGNWYFSLKLAPDIFSLSTYTKAA